MQNTTTKYSYLLVLNTCRLHVWEQWFVHRDLLNYSKLIINYCFFPIKIIIIKNEITWSLKSLILILLRP